MRWTRAAVSGLADRVGDAQRDVAVARREVLGHEPARHQHLERLVDVARDVEPRPMLRLARGAHRVHPPDGAADPPAILRVELVERAPPHLREHRVVDALDLAERAAAAEVHGRHRRHLRLDQVRQEGVLVEERLARPAAGPVELDDEPPLVLQLHLVHAVLEGAQRQAAPGGAEPADLDRVEHAVGSEREEGRRGLARTWLPPYQFGGGLAGPLRCLPQRHRWRRQSRRSKVERSDQHCRRWAAGTSLTRGGAPSGPRWARGGPGGDGSSRPRSHRTGRVDGCPRAPASRRVLCGAGPVGAPPVPPRRSAPARCLPTVVGMHGEATQIERVFLALPEHGAGHRTLALEDRAASSRRCSAMVSAVSFNALAADPFAATAPRTRVSRGWRLRRRPRSRRGGSRR